MSMNNNAAMSKSKKKRLKKKNKKAQEGSSPLIPEEGDGSASDFLPNDGSRNLESNFTEDPGSLTSLPKESMPILDETDQAPQNIAPDVQDSSITDVIESPSNDVSREPLAAQNSSITNLQEQSTEFAPNKSQKPLTAHADVQDSSLTDVQEQPIEAAPKDMIQEPLVAQDQPIEVVPDESQGKSTTPIHARNKSRKFTSKNKSQGPLVASHSLEKETKPSDDDDFMQSVIDSKFIDIDSVIQQVKNDVEKGFYQTSQKPKGPLLSEAVQHGIQSVVNSSVVNPVAFQSPDETPSDFLQKKEQPAKDSRTANDLQPTQESQPAEVSQATQDLQPTQESKPAEVSQPTQFLQPDKGSQSTQDLQPGKTLPQFQMDQSSAMESSQQLNSINQSTENAQKTLKSANRKSVFGAAKKKLCIIL
ncbi:unnamed protein product [Rhizopus stolonifer]